MKAVAASRFTKGQPFLNGLRDRGELVASLKLYQRTLRWGERELQARGIGAVFTPPMLRGRGYATTMIAAVLDRERSAGRDVAFLYSDIGPALYATLGFVAFPSRAIALRADLLDDGPSGAVALENRDWAAVRQCFDVMDARATWSFRRTPVVWEWIRLKWGNLPPDAQAVQLVARDRGRIAAYLVGVRVPSKDALIIDDLAMAEAGSEALVARLVRTAAGDLRQVRGWLPPATVRAALPRGVVRQRQEAAFMAVPLSGTGRAWLAEASAAESLRTSDPTWHADHL